MYIPYQLLKTPCLLLALFLSSCNSPIQPNLWPLNHHATTEGKGSFSVNPEQNNFNKATLVRFATNNFLVSKAPISINLETLVFTASGGESIIFSQKDGTWQARVQDPWTRLTSNLAVFSKPQANILRKLTTLANQPTYSHKYQLHLLNTPQNGKVVFIGVLGLLGGMQNEASMHSLHWAAEHGYFELVQDLAKSNQNINQTDFTGCTPLHYATEQGHLKIVQLLLEKGAAVNLTDMDGYTPLHLAAEKGYKEIVQLLLNNDADPNIADDFDCTPLHCATEKGHIDIVKLLLAKGIHNINRADQDGLTPVYLASSQAQLEILDLLLARGADPNIGDDTGCTPLHVAAEQGYVAIVQRLLQSDSDPNIGDILRITPLYTATKKGYLEIVQLLLANGANPNSSNNFGYTPLHCAAEQGYAEIIPLLLAQGAFFHSTLHGYTPLHLAAEHGHAKVVKLFLELTKRNFAAMRPVHWATLQGDPMPVAKVLEHHSAFIDTYLYDLTPLSIAAILGYQKVVTLLLGQGADPNLPNTIGHTALHLAISNKQAEISRLLLQANADPNKVSNNGDTPLHWAVKHNHRQIVEYLLQAGAYPAKADASGNTPLHIATDNGHINIVQTLTNYSHSRDLTLLNHNGHIPLHLAIIKGHLKLIDVFLQLRVEPNNPDQDGNTLLHLAAKKGRLEIISRLLKAGATINAQNNAGNTPLHLMAKQKNYALIVETMQAIESNNILLLKAIQCSMMYHNGYALANVADILAIMVDYCQGINCTLQNQEEKTLAALIPGEAILADEIEKKVEQHQRLGGWLKNTAIATPSQAALKKA
jgi:ankyrin repeat protein